MLLVILLSGIPFGSSAVAQDAATQTVAAVFNPEISALCQSVENQQVCTRACSAACKDVPFLSSNTAFCLSNPSIMGDTSLLENGSECGEIFAGVEGADVEVAVAPDCLSLPDPIEIAKCLNRSNGMPDCANGIPELGQNSALLASNVQSQLENYGGVLSLDPDTVVGIEALCELPVDTLSGFYVDATQNKDVLSSMQTQASELETCTVSFGDWLEETEESEELSDAAIRAFKLTLTGITDSQKALTTSVTQLEEAGPKIMGLIQFHLILCAANSNTSG